MPAGLRREIMGRPLRLNAAVDADPEINNNGTDAQ